MKIEWIFEDTLYSVPLAESSKQSPIVNTFPPRAIFTVFNAIPELKKLAKRLISPGGREQTLVPDIEALIDRIETARAITISLDTKTFSERALSKKMKLDVYRVIQEQLANIAKFSHATEAGISLHTVDHKVVLDIRDNGKPVDLSQRKNGICITDILLCAEVNNGHGTLESQPGTGSRLHVEFSMRSPQTQPLHYSQTHSALTHLV